MADSNIATFQHLLKRLEDQARCLDALLSQTSAVSSHLKATCIALIAIQEKWKRDIEKL